MTLTIWILGLYFFKVFIRTEGSKFEEYIVNGENVDIRDTPYFAIIVKSCNGRRQSLCGGSILTNDILLSAAHCFKKCENAEFEGTVGYDMRNTMNAEHVSKVSKFISHENYIEEKLIYDICLVLLKKKVMFDDKIKRVAIYNQPINATAAYLAGLGRVDQNKSPKRLQGMKTRIVSRELCKEFIGQIPLGTFCGEGFTMNQYAHRGDSGSPLIVDGYIQVGLVSFRRNVLSSVTVYTDVFYYFKWITRVVKELRCRNGGTLFTSKNETETSSYRKYN